MSVTNWAGGMAKGLWTVLVGMKITLKYMLMPPVTMHYPDEKWQVPERFRGQIKCDIEACIVCDLCVKACPVDCITINWKREEGQSGKIATNFLVDYQKCIFCGLCTEPCPTNAIFHSHDYEIASYSRQPHVIDWALPANKVINPKRKLMKKAAPKAAAKPAAKPAETSAAPAAAAATASPTQEAARSLPETAENKDKVVSVWIEPGCIVCDLCQDTSPEVFKVNPDTSVVLYDHMERWPELSDKIVEAADGCPVNVIKYKLGGQ